MLLVFADSVLLFIAHINIRSQTITGVLWILRPLNSFVYLVSGIYDVMKKRMRFWFFFDVAEADEEELWFYTGTRYHGDVVGSTLLLGIHCVKHWDESFRCIKK